VTIARAAEASNEGAAWLGAQERRPPLRWQHTFSLFWFGETISVLGNTTSSVLLPLLAVVELQASPWWVGLLTAASWVPWLVIGLPAGAWVDRGFRPSPRALWVLRRPGRVPVPVSRAAVGCLALALRHRWPLSVAAPVVVVTGTCPA